MKLLHTSSFACFTFMCLIQTISCDEPSDVTGIKWTCSCSSAHLVSQITLIASNCSATCDCKSATGRSSDYKWTCICAHEGFPSLAADNQNTDCFTYCNCTSGSSSTGTVPREYVSSKVVVVLLSVCVVFALAFVASMVCFIHQREKAQSSSLLSEEGSSYSSGANLISNRPTPQLESRDSSCFPVNSIAGCVNKVSLLFKSKIGSIHGTKTQFCYSELEHATNKFSDSNLIGLGASSHVYRGHLKDGRIVAVKRLKTPENYNADSVFLTEIELISRLHHCHIVPLIGYCSESLGKQTERLLVFDFMPNGNLRECLDGVSGKYLDWTTRVAIALGAARGLEYLHEAAAPKILHRDVKSTNILLDENWKPMITDLGMAKHISADGYSSSSSSPARMQGTFGYFAPEYAIVGKASLKSDVFSFGVVLLELITGRRPIYSWPGKGEESLVIWAAPRLQSSRHVITELPDPRLKGNFPEVEMQIMAYLAKECLLLDPDARPSMSEVVQVLLSIAPDTSKRRKLTINLYQNLSSHSLKDKHDLDEHYKQIDVIVDTEEPKKINANAWSPRYTPPSDVAHVYNIDDNMREGNLTSSKYVTTLIHLSSNGKSCHGDQDEENVDLTEPRFESFCVHHAESCSSL